MVELKSLTSIGKDAKRTTLSLVSVRAKVNNHHVHTLQAPP